MPDELHRESQPSAEPERRHFLTTASGLAMAAGLGAAYGTFGILLGKFVYPAGGASRGWLFVSTVERLAPGEALDFTSPAGAKIVIARQGKGTSAEDFLALSSVCPHLGCQVHWEATNDRFFCPCHNGAFDKSGNPIAGPPKAANQLLVRFPLKVESGLLYVEAPLAAVAACPSRFASHSEGVA
jgi:nitrite reductase/ring-hydroxylating ferredoxin subunit